MQFERMVARRYLRSKRQLRFITVIMLVSVVGITVGVAALIIVLSVFNGFSSVVTGVLVRFDPHIRIEAERGRSIAMERKIELLLEEDDRIAGYAVLPSLKAPTISKLYGQDWFAIETIVDEDVVRELVPKLQEAGAQGIIEYSLNKVI